MLQGLRAPSPLQKLRSAATLSLCPSHPALYQDNEIMRQRCSFLAGSECGGPVLGERPHLASFPGVFSKAFRASWSVNTSHLFP